MGGLNFTLPYLLPPVPAHFLVVRTSWYYLKNIMQFANVFPNSPSSHHLKNPNSYPVFSCLL